MQKQFTKDKTYTGIKTHAPPFLCVFICIYDIQARVYCERECSLQKWIQNFFWFVLIIFDE